MWLGGRSAVLSGDAAPRHAIVAYALGAAAQIVPGETPRLAHLPVTGSYIVPLCDMPSRPHASGRGENRPGPRRDRTRSARD